MVKLIRSVIGIAAVLSAATAFAAGTVDLDVLTERGFPPEATHDWLKQLSKLGVGNVRIRGASGGEKPEVQTRGTEKAPVYHVTGVLSASGTLHLPGGRFGIEHSRQLSEYFKNLAEHGPGGRKKVELAAFGLSEEQFSSLTSDLKQTVGVSTKGLTVGEAVAKIGAPLNHRVVVDPSAKAALAGGEKVLDELAGISSGTALAAALRPAGLVVVPRRSGEEVDLVVSSSRGAKELWPIGWAPDEALAKIVPGLVVTTNVEIEDTALADALAAVSKRLGTPVLFDHNNLARQGINVAEARITLPAQRVIYRTALRKMLHQARLKHEVRVDEAGKPLLWISPLK